MEKETTDQHIEAQYTRLTRIATEAEFLIGSLRRSKLDLDEWKPEIESFEQAIKDWREHML